MLAGARSIALVGTTAMIGAHDKIVIVDLDKPLEPRVIKTLPFAKPSSIAVQFRYAFITDAKGLHVVDVTDIARAEEVTTGFIPLPDARSVYLARTYAYIAAGQDGLLIVDIEKPGHPRIYQRFTDDGKISDLNDVKIATTNASLFAYLADGRNGLKVVQLTDPERVPNFYGFSPEVKPLVIAHRRTNGPALAISKPLDRDRAVDESGNQVSIFGRIGSRPFNAAEMRRLYISPSGRPFTVP